MHGDQYALATNECQGLGRIHFDFDRFNVKPAYMEQVNKIYTCLEKNPSYTIIIEGHTDERGTPSYNMVLSDKRARAVKDHLVSRLGIASYRIETVSYGEQKPLVSERSEYAWGRNRRAEVVVKVN